MKGPIRPLFLSVVVSLAITALSGAATPTRSGGTTVAKLLVLGDSSAGYLRSSTGGALSAEPITVEVGLGMSRAFYGWVASSWRPRLVSRFALRGQNGAIVSLDFDGKPVSTQVFQGAWITQTIIPAMDASLREAVTMAVSFQPSSEVVKAGGIDFLPGAGSKAAIWLRSNFRVSIDGLPTSRISKVGRLVVAKTAEGGVAFSDVVVQLAARDALPWIDWRQRFLQAGPDTAGLERTGSMAFLDERMTEVGGVGWSGLGIVKLEEVQDASGQVAFYRATMSCRAMTLSLPGW